MDLLDSLASTRGFFTRADARDAGYSEKSMAEAARTGVWHRIRRGYYTYEVLWSALDDVGRHRVRSACALHSLGDAVVLSHVSASVMHGLDIWGIPLDRVHVTRLDGGAGRIEGDVVHHVGTVSDADIVEIDGHRVIRPVRAAIEAMGRSSGEVALAHFNSMLRTTGLNGDDLMAQFMAMEPWPFTQHLHIPVRMASPLPESIGESRGVWFCFRHAVPAPICQYDVRGPDGSLLARCDWAWPELGRLGEFDGKLKYCRILRPGQDPGAVVFAEKQREDMLREVTGMGMIRVIWSDYDRPRVLRARLARSLGMAG